ncbi:MAG: hypothetical protein RR777_04990 [Christensenellaceae bacterium]
MSETKKKKKVWIAILTILIVAAVVVGTLMMTGVINIPHESKAQRDLAAKIGQLPNKSQEEIERVLDQVVKEGMFNITANSEMVSRDGNLTVGIENVPGNRYLMQVDVVLDDTGEIVYSSGIIEPGYFIEEAKTIKPIAPGEYKATAVFTAINAQTEEEEGKSAVEVTIKAF